VEFDEDFLSELVSKHMTQFQKHQRPRLSNAFEIYMQENTSSHRRKFQTNANQYFRTFTTFFGDLYLDELSHSHITRYRDHLLARGLHPNSIRKHNNILNAMINMAFKHLAHSGDLAFVVKVKTQDLFPTSPKSFYCK
jgi:hypothetical protein